MIDTLLRHLPLAHAGSRSRSACRSTRSVRGADAASAVERGSARRRSAASSRPDRTIAPQMPVVFPVHPRTQPAPRRSSVSPTPSGRDPDRAARLHRFPEPDVARALILTDSGGLQEESTALGIPCLTLRENTERPVTVDDGTNRVVGVDPATSSPVIVRHSAIRDPRACLLSGTAGPPNASPQFSRLPLHYGAASTLAIRKIAFSPCSGRELCTARPRVWQRQRTMPLCATTICKFVGSATIAASGRRGMIDLAPSPSGRALGRGGRRSPSPSGRGPG